MSIQTGDSSGSLLASDYYAGEVAESTSRQAEAVARTGESSATSPKWSPRILQQVVALPFALATAQV
jgi:hypothetical protein